MMTGSRVLPITTRAFSTTIQFKTEDHTSAASATSCVVVRSPFSSVGVISLVVMDFEHAVGNDAQHM